MFSERPSASVQLSLKAMTSPRWGSLNQMKDFPKGLKSPHLMMTFPSEWPQHSKHPDHSRLLIISTCLMVLIKWVRRSRQGKKTPQEPQASDEVVVLKTWLPTNVWLAVLQPSLEPGARRGDGTWLGQMWPEALGEWSWLNPNKLCYSFDPPCTRLLSHFSHWQSESRLCADMSDLAQHQPLSNINISHLHNQPDV